MRLGLIAVFALLAACSGNKLAPERMPAPLLQFKPAMEVRTAWSVKVGKSNAYTFGPAEAGGSVYAAAADGSIVRVAADSGRLFWRINAGARLAAGVGTDGYTIAVAGEEGVLLAFDSEGKPLWKAQASSEILTPPAVGQGLVVVRSVDNRVAAYDARTGARRWVAERSIPPLSLRAASGIVISGAGVYAGFAGGRLLALSVVNGAPMWEVAVGYPRGTNDLERIADVAGSPVISGRSICAVAYQGRIGCVDAATGATRWGREFSSRAGLTADQRFLFAVDERSSVHAFDSESGTPVWQSDKLVNRGLSAPASFGPAVALGDSAGYVHFLSREDGSMLARVAIDGSPLVAAPLAIGSNVIFQTKAGTLVALTTD